MSGVIHRSKIGVDAIKEIISSDSEMKQKLDELPFNMKMDDIIRFLGFCKSTVYVITQQDDFPKLQTGVSKLIVPRPLFLDWYYRKCKYSH